MWTRFPQLRSLPEGALPHFIAAQLVPAGASSEQDLKALVVQFERLLPVYRQCRHALHMLAANAKPFLTRGGGEPAVLMPLSTGRWPTWLEMFPGVTEDSLSPYGPAVALRLDVISRD